MRKQKYKKEDKILLKISYYEDSLSKITELLEKSNKDFSISELESKKVFNQKYLFIPVIIIFFLSTFLTLNIFAEQIGSSPESGTDSKFTQLYDDLVTLGIGSEGSGDWGDWGSRWNRIMSASKRDLVNYEAMSLQRLIYRDPGLYGSAAWGQWELTNNAVGKNVYHSGRTGLYWSPVYAAMSSNFTRATCPFFSSAKRGDYNGTEPLCGNAINYCATLELDANGDGLDDTKWYLPTQVEIIEAYLDGIYLGTNSAWATTSSFSTSTEVQSHPTYYIYISFGGIIYMAPKTEVRDFRCVLRDLN